jgi:Tfp pilus assembly protein PilF
MKTKNYNIYKNIGNIYGLKGQEAAKAGDAAKAKELTDKAIDSYNTAISLNDKDADMFVNLAITYTNTNQHDLAAVNYCKAIKLRPDDIDLVERQALAYFNSGNTKAALDNFIIQAQHDPENSNAWFNMAVCYNRLGDKQNALTNALKAQKMDHPVDQKFLDDLRN